MAGNRVRFHQLQLGRYAVEPVFDRGVADAEGALHLFNGTVAAHEDHDKYLVLSRSPGQRRQLGTSGDGYIAAVQTDLFDDQRCSPG